MQENEQITNKPVKRKTKYSLKLAQEICTAVATSSEGLEKLCALNPHWPIPNTIYGWRIMHAEFGEMYARAKQNQVEVLVDEIIDIADDDSRDTLTKYDHNGEAYEVCNNEWINRSRLRVDTRKWLASKLAPRLYGDKVTNEHTGKDGKPIEVASTITVYIPDNGRNDRD